MNQESYNEQRRFNKNSDIISIHVVYADRYKNLITKNELSMMKKTASLINTSRGLIINENDLVDALKDEKIAGAGLDVYDKELFLKIIN